MAKKAIASIIFLTGILMHFTIVTSLILGPTFLRIFSFTKTQLGIIYGASSIGVIVMASLAGKIIRKIGAANSLFTALWIAISSIAILIFSKNFYMLFIAFSLIGTSNALLINSNTSMLSDLYPEKIRKIIALYSAAYFGIAAMLSPAVGQWLNIAKTNNYNFLSFRLPYAFIFIFLLILLTLVNRIIIPGMSAFLKNKNQKYPDNLTKTSKIPLANCWRIPVMAFLHSIIVSSLLTWINPMAQDKFISNEFEGALFVGMITVGLAFGRLSIAGFKLVMGDRMLLALGTFTGGFFILAGLLSPDYKTALFFISAGSYLSSVSLPCIISIAGRLFYFNRPGIYGYIYVSMGIAGIAIPPLIGRLADFGIPLWAVLMIIPSASLALGILSFMWKFNEVKASTPQKR